MPLQYLSYLVNDEKILRADYTDLPCFWEEKIVKKRGFYRMILADKMH